MGRKSWFISRSSMNPVYFCQQWSGSGGAGMNDRVGPVDRFRQRSVGKELDEISYGELWRFVFKTVYMRSELDTLARGQVSLPVIIPAMSHTHPTCAKCSTSHLVARTSLLLSSVSLPFDFSAYISALRNLDKLLPDCTVLCPRRQYSLWLTGPCLRKVCNIQIPCLSGLLWIFMRKWRKNSKHSLPHIKLRWRTGINRTERQN
jgi:hypothetical protein